MRQLLACLIAGNLSNMAILAIWLSLESSSSSSCTDAEDVRMALGLVRTLADLSESGQQIRRYHRKEGEG